MMIEKKNLASGDTHEEIAALKNEVERLREKEREKDDYIQRLKSENRKNKDRLLLVERLLISSEYSRSLEKEEKVGKGYNKRIGRMINDKRTNDGNESTTKNQYLVKTFVKLTNECDVINKKFKYLRKLMVANNQKLNEIENNTKAEVNTVTKRKDKCCQAKLNKDDEDKSKMGEMKKLDQAASDRDDLLTDIFYLPTHPELPDLRLFENI